VAFSPDGQRIVTGSMDQTARMWDATSGRRLLILKHEGALDAVAFSPDGQRIVTGGNDRMVRVWDAVGGRQLLAFKACDGGWIRPTVFSPDGRRILPNPMDRQGVGRGQRPRIVRPSRAQQRGLRGVFSGWPKDRDRQL
jgi:WD40 repeat protein